MRYRLAFRRRGLHRPILSSWTCFRAPLRSLRWIGPNEPRESRSSKLDERFLSGVNSQMSGGSCRFSVICIRRSPDPGNRLFLPALLTRRPLTSPTSWVRWSRAILPCRARDSSLPMTRTDKYNYMFGVYACGLWNLNVIL